MISPRYTLIVPMTRYDGAERVIAYLQSRPANEAPLTQGEVIIALGRQPARQRNAALAQARGDITVFFDNDCVPGPDYWERLARHFADPRVEIVGGPVLLAPGATWLERVAQSLLAHPGVTGPVSARYAGRGPFRRSGQTELILCNLAVRRSIFTRIGALSTELYPNEENEWLDRAAAAGAGIFYDPALTVARPQRSTLPGLLRALFRYGIGRTRQLRVGRQPGSRHQLAPLLLVALVGALIFVPRITLLAGLLGWMIYALVLACSDSSPATTLSVRMAAAALAPLVPLAYGAGQLYGFIALFQRASWPEESPQLCDLTGKPLRPLDPVPPQPDAIAGARPD